MGASSRGARPLPVTAPHRGEIGRIMATAQLTPIGVGIHNVLIATDFSRFSNQALDIGLKLAKAYQAHAYVAFVVPSDEFMIAGPDAYVAAKDAARRDLESLKVELQKTHTCIEGKRLSPVFARRRRGHQHPELRAAEARRPNRHGNARPRRAGEGANGFGRGERLPRLRRFQCSPSDRVLDMRTTRWLPKISWLRQTSARQERAPRAMPVEWPPSTTRN